MNRLSSARTRVRRKLGRVRRRVRRDLDDLRDVRTAWWAQKVLARRRAGAEIAVVVHLFYPEVWPLLADYIERLDDESVDVVVTVPKQNRHAIPTVRRSFPGARCVVVPNRGRDVLPFLLVADVLDRAGYQAVLKIHSKKSQHFGGGDQWRDRMLEELLPSDPSARVAILGTLRSARTGLIGPRSTYFPLSTYWAGNAATVEKLLRPAVPEGALERLRTPKELGFFAGTMFWARLDALRPLLRSDVRAFQREPTPMDGTLAHALERAMTVLPELLGLDQFDTDGTRVAPRPATAEVLPDWYRSATKAAIAARRANGG